MSKMQEACTELSKRERKPKAKQNRTVWSINPAGWKFIQTGRTQPTKFPNDIKLQEGV
jgi:hypothetical protein